MAKTLAVLMIAIYCPVVVGDTHAEQQRPNVTRNGECCPF